LELGLRGKNAVITGASRGIGLAIACTLAAEGVNLLLAARTADALSSIKDMLTARHEVKVHAVAVDLASKAGVKRLAEVIRKKMLPLDILINNAGATLGGSLTALDVKRWRTSYDLKLWGYILLTRAVLPIMYEQGSGVVLNIIGNGGAQPSHRYIAGGIANAGLMNFTSALADEAGPQGVRVVAINPGPTRTDRVRALITHLAKERALSVEAAEAAVIDYIPLGRIGEPEDMASVAAFLVSPRAGYITGTTIPVDGGGTIRGI
jgi:NAD(P)-dependent dehydrogenase (short-subunit alcohol dehydrogenase family)